MKRLFRKVDDKSSMYEPNHPGTVRREGSYMYEEFLTTGESRGWGAEGGGGGRERGRLIHVRGVPHHR